MQFYPDFALFSTLGGMNLDHDFVQLSKLNEDQEKNWSSPKLEHFFPRIQVKTKKKIFTNNGTLFPQIQVKTKKKVFTKYETLFSPNLSGHLRSDALQSQIIEGGMQDVEILKLLGGDTVKLLGGIYPPIFSGF